MHRILALSALSCLALAACTDDTTSTDDSDVRPPVAQPDAKVRVTPTSGLATREAGGDATFTVELTEPPVADVVIHAHVTDEGEGRLDETRLVFTPDDLGPRTVRVRGVDDSVEDGNQPYQVILGEAISADLRYQSVPVADVAVTNVDDDTVGVTVIAADRLTVTEGGTATFTVQLGSKPTAEVIVRLAADATEATLSSDALHFYPRSWNEVQTVTVTGVGETIDDGDKSLVITTARVETSDTAYAGLDPADVSLTKVDDDAASVVLPTGSIHVVEEQSVQVALRLATQPLAGVIVELASADGLVSSNPASFDAGNWDRPQLVTLTARSDGYADPDREVVVEVRTSRSADPFYRDRPVQTLAVTVTSIEVPRLIIESPRFELNEAADCIDVAVGVGSLPRAPVIVEYVSENPAVGVVTPATVTFDATAVSGTVQVCAVDNDRPEGTRTFDVRQRVVASADPRYAELGSSYVGYRVVDDEVMPVVRTAEENPYTTAWGRSTQIFVRLGSRPPVDVQVPVSSLAPDLATADTLLWFTPDTWNVEQEVTVTGRRELIFAPVRYRVMVGPTFSEDPAFAGQAALVDLEHRPQ